jgi:beta propeller repeat protein
MKKRHLRILLSIVLFCLIALTHVSAFETTPGTETVLFILHGQPTHLAFDGDRLFFLQVNRNENVTERGLYLYNLTEESQRLVIRIGERSERNLSGNIPAVLEIAGMPVVSGDRVVFSEIGILLTNISTGSTVQLTNRDDATLPVSELKHNQNPWIDGDRTVWTEHGGGFYSSVSGGRVVLLNLTSGERQYVPAGMPGNQSYPRISGDYLIWRDYRNEGRDYPDLYLFDLRTGNETRLTAPKTLRGIPYIQGDSVFWEEKNLYGIDTIIRYTISTKTRTDLGPGWTSQIDVYPPVSDNRIVWLVSENPFASKNLFDITEDDDAIMVMDLDTGEKSQVTPFHGGLSFPMISENRIIYLRGAGEDWEREPREIVLFTLTPRSIYTKSTIRHWARANATPSPLPDQKKVSTSMTTPTASTGFSSMLLIIGLAAGAILGRPRYKG